MAIRRLNYTGRKPIHRSDTRITVREYPDRPATFDADLRLGEYKLPAGAYVFVEAYRQATWMRFPFGRVGELTPPPDLERILTEFESPDRVLFRVRVTSAEGRQGIMLAEADKIRAAGLMKSKRNACHYCRSAPPTLATKSGEWISAVIQFC